MKTISTKAIVALMAATLGLSAVAPVMAQSAAPSLAVEAGQNQTTAPRFADRGFRPGEHGPGQNGSTIDLLNFERGGEAIEIALVRLSHRLDLSDAQKTLLETLKTDALAAAEGLKAATDTLRPTPAAEGETVANITLADRLETRIALNTARLEALKSVQPALTAFFDSLTDEQKTDLMPQRGPEDGRPSHFGKQGNGSERPSGQRPAGPGAPQQPGPAEQNNG